MSAPYRTERYLRPIYLASDLVCSEYVPGDYLEFGVFRGDSFVAAYHSINKAVKNWASYDRARMSYSDPQRAAQAFAVIQQNEIRFFAFDSFDGLPEPEGVDMEAARISKGRYDCPKEKVKRNSESKGGQVTSCGYQSQDQTRSIRFYFR